MLLLAFVLGFALVSTAVRYVIAMVGMSDLDYLSSKPRWAADMRADVVFVGPSYIEMGINPKVFDIELSKYVSLKSYNMAMDGQSVPELSFVLRRFFAQRGCCAKYVVISPGFEVTNVARYRLTVRSADYFDLHNAFEFWSYLNAYKPQPPAPPLDLEEYAKSIVVSTLGHYSNIGLGLRPLGIGASEDSLPKMNRGFHPDERAISDEKRLADWRFDVDDLRKKWRRFDEPLVTDAMFARLVDVIDLIENQGVRAIIVRPPNPWHWPYGQAFVNKYRRECPDGPPLLDFGDPDKYPVLYDAANRYDVAHLNASGAGEWSRALADQIGKLILLGRLDHPSYCKRLKV